MMMMMVWNNLQRRLLSATLTARVSVKECGRKRNFYDDNDDADDDFELLLELELMQLMKKHRKGASCNQNELRCQVEFYTIQLSSVSHQARVVRHNTLQCSSWLAGCFTQISLSLLWQNI